MTLGTLDAMRWLIDRMPAGTLRQVLRDPPLGVFNERSWRFWHLRLGCRPGSRHRPHDGMTFRPRLDLLPAAQRRLWPALAEVPEPFVLHGGTALAHRAKAAASSPAARRPSVR